MSKRICCTLWLLKLSKHDINGLAKKINKSQFFSGFSLFGHEWSHIPGKSCSVGQLVISMDDKCCLVVALTPFQLEVTKQLAIPTKSYQAENFLSKKI